jgi:hypothetical protein
VLDVEAAQERLPQQIDLSRGGVDAGPPQPDRFRDRATGQPGDLKADDGALDQ